MLHLWLQEEEIFSALSSTFHHRSPSSEKFSSESEASVLTFLQCTNMDPFSTILKLLKTEIPQQECVRQIPHCTSSLFSYFTTAIPHCRQFLSPECILYSSKGRVCYLSLQYMLNPSLPQGFSFIKQFSLLSTQPSLFTLESHKRFLPNFLHVYIRNS